MNSFWVSDSEMGDAVSDFQMGETVCWVTASNGRVKLNNVVQEITYSTCDCSDCELCKSGKGKRCYNDFHICNLPCGATVTVISSSGATLSHSNNRKNLFKMVYGALQFLISIYQSTHHIVAVVGFDSFKF